MAQDQLGLYNLASIHLGGRASFTSLTQKHRYIEVFDDLYDTVRKLVFRAAWWPSVTKVARLDQITTRAAGDWNETQPFPGAGYMYELPDDYVHPRYLTSYGHFTLHSTGDEVVLSAHETGATLIYTFDQTQVSLWEFELYMCMSRALAAYASMSVQGVASRAELNQGLANEAILMARESFADVTDEPTTYVSSYHRARGYYGGGTPTRFMFPHGGLVAVGETASVK